MNKRRTQFTMKTTSNTNQLLLQFPVSSGQQHRKNENYSNFIEASTPYQTVASGSVNTQQDTAPVTAIKPLQQQSEEQSIFANSEKFDVNTLVQQRWQAMKKLYENPNNTEAMQEMYDVQAKMQSCLQNVSAPGQFTGSTGAKVLTPDELSSGYQAWAHQDQLLTAQPVTGGMGMFLLKKMGWKPGEGLGKYKKGNTEPISFRVKLDKRGLASNEDIIDSLSKLTQPSNSQSKVDTSVPTLKTLGGKHPVSLLGEYCSKRRIGAPKYEEFSENASNNKKKYLFKVIVNGVAYKPTVANLNKKLAKIEAAQLCLQSIGVLP